jgi:carboxypeptidase family protein/TonB-dependent receptor-like protein
LLYCILKFGHRSINKQSEEPAMIRRKITSRFYGPAMSLCWLTGLLFFFFALRPVYAQSTYGSVVGVVEDANRAAVAGARVTLVEVQTNVTRATTTGSDGSYEFVNLTQGLYRIEVENRGFNKFTTRDFELAARQTVRIDAALAPAGVTAEVQIADVAPLINTENPTIVGSKTNREIQQLPFTFRTRTTSPIEAIAVLPEVQKGSGTEFSLSGSLPWQNEVSVDGILTTNIRRNGIGDGAVNIFPSIEGVQEIRVASINNNAEFAQVGDITTITKPGTNSFHGSAFWNYNGNKLNANPNFFAPRLPSRRVNNDVGGSLSGPIFKNKTFFFGTYERLSIYGLTEGSATVPEADFRQGNFSSLATPIIDPSTGQPFPGNIIPANKINQVSKLILDKYIPAPNVGPRERRYSISSSEISNQFDARVDHNFTDRHTVFGRFSFKNLDLATPTAYQVSGPRTFANPTRNLVVSDSFAIRPNLLNEARFGLTFSDLLPRTGLIGEDFVSDTGLRLLSQTLPKGSGSTFIAIAGYTRFGEGREEPLTQSTYQIADNLTWIKGRHTFKGGADFLRFNWTSPAVFTGADDFGVFNFNNNLPGGAGHPVANFLLGAPSNTDQTATGPNIDGVAWHYGFFFQDEWKFSNSVTLNLGLRYELHPGFVDRQLNITNFLRDTPNGDVVVPNEESLRLAKPAFTAALGTSRILTAKEAGLPESLRKTDSNNFGPRIGVAWRPSGATTTVIRAGYGIYTTRMLGAIFNSLTAVHTSDNVTFNNTYDATTRTFGFVFPNTFAGSANKPDTTVGSQNFSTANDPDFKDPYTQQWSLTVERELNRDNALRVTYSGSHSVKLTMAPDLNQIQPNTVGFANLPRTARPYPNWFRVNTRDNGGDSNYHDLTVQFTGRMQKAGLNYTSSYKWSKGISNIEERGSSTPNFQSEINGRTDNRFDSRYLRGPISAIPYHRFVTNFIWDLPFGRGRSFGADWNAVVNGVLGGWTLSSIMNFQSGQHLTAFHTSHCGSGTNCYGNEKVDRVAGEDPNSGPKTTEQWFNTNAFSNRAFFDSAGMPIFIGRFGAAGYGSIEGPGIVGVDFAAFKEFSIRENMKLRLQTQVKNLPNHPNLGNPDTNLSSGNYGKIRSLNPNFGLREVLLGARLTF